jgi:hypothetical protein
LPLLGPAIEAPRPGRRRIPGVPGHVSSVNRTAVGDGRAIASQLIPPGAISPTIPFSRRVGRMPSALRAARTARSPPSRGFAWFVSGVIVAVAMREPTRLEPPDDADLSRLQCQHTDRPDCCGGDAATSRARLWQPFERPLGERDRKGGAQSCAQSGGRAARLF